jgi:hypothetical protein
MFTEIKRGVQWWTVNGTKKDWISNEHRVFDARNKISKANDNPGEREYELTEYKSLPAGLTRSTCGVRPTRSNRMDIARNAFVVFFVWRGR